MTEDRTRVALADDDVLLREGLASLLDRSGFDVVGQCGDAPQLVALVRQLRPELVIVDIRMPPGHSTEGLDAAREIRAEFPDTAILVLSAHVEVEHAMDLLASGQRSGYLLKSRVINVDDFHRDAAAYRPGRFGGRSCSGQGKRAWSKFSLPTSPIPRSCTRSTGNWRSTGAGTASAAIAATTGRRPVIWDGPFYDYTVGVCPAGHRQHDR